MGSFQQSILQQIMNKDKNNKSLKILVTDAQELAGLGAIRSLGRAGHHIIAGYPSSLGPPASVFSRWCRSSIKYPDPWLRHLDFCDWLVKELDCTSYDALLPVSEAALAAAARVQGLVSKEIIWLMPPDRNLPYCLSKFHSMRAAMKAGLPVAPTVFIHDGTSNSPWDLDFSRLEYPFVIKTDNRLSSDGIYCRGQLSFVHHQEEARIILEECRAVGCGLIAQEFIPGSGAAAFILRWGGISYLSFSHRRLHEVPWTGGASSFRESRHDLVIQQYGETLLNHLDFQGLAMVEFRKKEASRIPYFMEINGRLWGSLALALHAGIDFPAAWLDCHLYGHPMEKRIVTEYPEHLKCINIFPGEVNHLITIFRSNPETGTTIPPSKVLSLLKFIVLLINPFLHHDYLWRRDPKPGFFQAGTVLTKLIKKLLKVLPATYEFRKRRHVLSAARKEHQDKLQGTTPYFSSLPQKILFICYGNIYRSAFAELYWNQIIKTQYPIGFCHAASAGFHQETGRLIPQRIQTVVQSSGLKASSHRSRLVTQSMIDESDVIMVMDYRNWHDLTNFFPQAGTKTIFLGLFSSERDIEVNDPYLMDSLQTDECFKKLKRALHCLAKTIAGAKAEKFSV